MNLVFFALIAVAFAVAAYQHITMSLAGVTQNLPMDALTTAMTSMAGTAVELSIGLIGVVSLFLGLMKILEESGLLRMIALLLKPLMIRLFPEIPPDHPALGAIILNLSANFLGLGNAATPFGIKAMEELNRLNPVKGTATNAMILFLGLNTACITLLPTTAVALRAENGSKDPAGIVVTTLFATVVATIVVILSAKLLQRFFPDGHSVVDATPSDSEASTDEELTLSTGEPGYPLWVSLVALGGVIGVIPVLLIYGKLLSPWIMPGLMVGVVGWGLFRRVRVYEAFVSGAKEGFDVAVRIIPYLVAILVAIAMFRASGAMDLLITPLGRLTAPLGLPPEALSMSLLRTLSGSGSLGLLASYLKDPAIGPDSYTGYLVSTLYGSSETTFYILAVYFGAVQIQRLRHALWVGLLADVAALIAAIGICRSLYG